MYGKAPQLSNSAYEESLASLKEWIRKNVLLSSDSDSFLGSAELAFALQTSIFRHHRLIYNAMSDVFGKKIHIVNTWNCRGWSGVEVSTCKFLFFTVLCS